MLIYKCYICIAFAKATLETVVQGLELAFLPTSSTSPASKEGINWPMHISCFDLLPNGPLIILDIFQMVQLFSQIFWIFSKWSHHSLRYLEQHPIGPLIILDILGNFQMAPYYLRYFGYLPNGPLIILDLLIIFQPFSDHIPVHFKLSGI